MTSPLASLPLVKKVGVHDIRGTLLGVLITKGSYYLGVEIRGPLFS